MSTTIREFLLPLLPQKNSQFAETIPATENTQVATAPATISVVKELMHLPNATTL